MLDLAIKHKDAIELSYANIIFDDRYKYLFSSLYQEAPKIEKDTWQCHQFASINKKGEVVGYISYGTERETQNVGRLNIVNFKLDCFANSKIFGNDLLQVIHDIFYKFNFNKLSFTVVVGNPIEKFYDRKIEELGGRIVGIKEKEVKLIDNQFYDLKIYEVTKENLKWRY